MGIKRLSLCFFGLIFAFVLSACGAGVDVSMLVP